MGFKGIANINGVAIANVGKYEGVAKADIWSITDEQRQESLFRVLSNTNWGSYTIGSNSASFVAVGSGSSRAQVFFQINNHTSGDTYNFTCNKIGTTAGRTFEFAVSEDADLLNLTGGGLLDVGASSGSISGSVTASSTNATMYIGFRMMASGSTDTFTINNLIVTSS